MGNCLSDLTGDSSSGGASKRRGKSGKSGRNNTPADSTTKRDSDDASEDGSRKPSTVAVGEAPQAKKKQQSKRPATTKKEQPLRDSARIEDGSVRSNSHANRKNGGMNSSAVADTHSASTASTATKRSPRLKPASLRGASESGSTPRQQPSTPLMLGSSQGALMPQPISPLMDQKRSPAAAIANPLVAPPQLMSSPCDRSTDSPPPPPPRMLTFARAATTSPDGVLRQRSEKSSSTTRAAATSSQMQPIEQICDTTLLSTMTSDPQDSKEVSRLSATGESGDPRQGLITRAGSSAAPMLAITAPSNGALLQHRSLSPQAVQHDDVTTPNLPMSNARVTPTTSPTVRRSSDEAPSYVTTSNASIQENNPTTVVQAGAAAQLLSADENIHAALPHRHPTSPSQSASRQDDFGNDRTRRLSPFELPRSTTGTKNEEEEELIEDDELIYGSASNSPSGSGQHKVGKHRKVSPLRGNHMHHPHHHHGSRGSPSTSPRVVRASPAPSASITLTKSVPQPWSHSSSSESPRQATQPRSAKEMSLMSLPASVLPERQQQIPRSPQQQDNSRQPLSSPASPIRVQQQRTISSGEESLPQVHSIGDMRHTMSSQRNLGEEDGGRRGATDVGRIDHRGEGDVLAGSMSNRYSSGTFTTHNSASGRAFRTHSRGSSFASHTSSSNLSTLTASGVGGGAVGIGFRVQAGKPHHQQQHPHGGRLFSASGSEMMPDLSSFGRHSSMGSRDSNELGSRRSSDRRGNSVAFSMDGFFDHEGHQQHRQQQVHQHNSRGGGHNNNRSVSFSDAGEETRRDTTMSLMSGRSLRAMSTASSEWGGAEGTSPQQQQQLQQHRPPPRHGLHGVPPMALANFQGKDEGSGPLPRRVYH